MASGPPEQYFQQRLLPPTVIYYIRHGEPEAQYKDCYYGQLDVPLSDKGRRQSAAVAERLATVPFDAIYSSDLSRAHYLAELLAESRDLPIRRLEVFRERHMGVLQGKSVPELERDHAELYFPWRADRVNFRVPEAENFHDLHSRVTPAIEELVRAFMGRRVALVCHAGPIRIALAHALGMPLDHIFRLGVNHCSIHVVEYPREAPPRVTLMNG